MLTSPVPVVNSSSARQHEQRHLAHSFSRPPCFATSFWILVGSLLSVYGLACCPRTIKAIASTVLEPVRLKLQAEAQMPQPRTVIFFNYASLANTFLTDAQSEAQCSRAIKAMISTIFEPVHHEAQREAQMPQPRKHTAFQQFEPRQHVPHRGSNRGSTSSHNENNSVWRFQPVQNFGYHST